MKRWRKAAIVWMVAVVSTAAGLTAQGEPSEGEKARKPTLAEGQRLLQAGETEKAISVLEAVVAADPKSDAGWAALGQARAGAEQDEAAVPAFLKAASITQRDSRRDGALYGAARSLARLGQHEQSLLILGQLRRDHRFDLTNMDADAAFGEMLNDPRFQALQPTAEQLASPFVEDVRVIRHWAGEAAGDNFGWIARRIGDVDGDGVSDLVTSAPLKNIGGAQAGRVYVYSSKSGDLLWSRDGSPGFILGRGVEAAGDVNGDGVPDAVASAPGGNRVFVFSGKDGKTLLEIEAAQEGEAIGQHVKGIGDWNGDGRSDVLVGAPQFDDSDRVDAGRAAIYSGADGAVLWQEVGEQAGGRFGETVTGGFDGKRLVWMVGAPAAGEVKVYRKGSQGPHQTLKAEITGQSFGGMFMSVVGDVDADGTRDLYVSDWQDGVLGPSTGRIYVFSGADGRRLLTLTGEAAGEGFGIGSAEAGDVDDDGFDDLVIGAWRHASKAPGAGKIYVVSGKTGTVQRSITADVAGETFGFDAQGIGDVDGDGTVDLLLTSAWSRVSGPRSGRVFIIAGEKP